MTHERDNHISVFTDESYGVKYTRQLNPLHLQAENINAAFEHFHRGNSETRSWICAGNNHPFYEYVTRAHDMDLEDLDEMKNLVSAYLSESVSSSEDAEQLVLAILAVFVTIHDKRMKRKNLEDRNYHKLLLFAARICCQYNIPDPKYVEFILICRMVQLNNSREWFEFLSPTGQMSYLRDSILYPFAPDQEDESREKWITDKHLEALEYFLRCARNVNVVAFCQAYDVPTNILPNFHLRNDQVKERAPYQFDVVVGYINTPIYTSIHGIDNVTPLTWACQQASPKAVKLLLRYGASPIHLFDNLKRPHCNLVQPLYALGNSLNTRFHRYLEIKHKIDDPAASFWERVDIERTAALVECLRYILRAKPFLPVQFLCEYRDSLDTFKHLEKSFLNGICLDKRLKWFLPQKLTQNVPTLESISKHTIRTVLMDRHLLPEGIQCLPLPSILKEYLDLERD